MTMMLPDGLTRPYKALELKANRGWSDEKIAEHLGYDTVAQVGKDIYSLTAKAMKPRVSENRDLLARRLENAYSVWAPIAGLCGDRFDKDGNLIKPDLDAAKFVLKIIQEYNALMGIKRVVKQHIKLESEHRSLSVIVAEMEKLGMQIPQTVQAVHAIEYQEAECLPSANGVAELVEETSHQEASETPPPDLP